MAAALKLPAGIAHARVSYVRVSYPDRVRRVPVWYRRGHFAVVPWFDYATGRNHPRSCNLVYVPRGTPLCDVPITSDDAIALAHLEGAYDTEPSKHKREHCQPFLALLARATRRQWACKLCGYSTGAPDLLR